MNAIYKEYLGEFLGNIPLIPEKLTKDILQEILVLQGIAVVNVGLGNGKVQNLPFVIYD